MWNASQRPSMSVTYCVQLPEDARVAKLSFRKGGVYCFEAAPLLPARHPMAGQPLVNVVKDYGQNRFFGIIANGPVTVHRGKTAAISVYTEVNIAGPDSDVLHRGNPLTTSFGHRKLTHFTNIDGYVWGIEPLSTNDGAGVIRLPMGFCLNVRMIRIGQQPAAAQVAVAAPPAAPPPPGGSDSESRHSGFEGLESGPESEEESEAESEGGYGFGNVQDTSGTLGAGPRVTIRPVDGQEDGLANLMGRVDDLRALQGPAVQAAIPQGQDTEHRVVDPVRLHGASESIDGAWKRYAASQIQTQDFEDVRTSIERSGWPGFVLPVLAIRTAIEDTLGNLSNNETYKVTWTFMGTNQDINITTGSRCPLVAPHVHNFREFIARFIDTTNIFCIEEPGDIAVTVTPQ